MRLLGFVLFNLGGIFTAFLLAGLFMDQSGSLEWWQFILGPILIGVGVVLIALQALRSKNKN